MWDALIVWCCFVSGGCCIKNSVLSSARRGRDSGFKCDYCIVFSTSLSYRDREMAQNEVETCSAQ